MKRYPTSDTSLLFLLLLPTVGIIVGFILGNFTQLKFLTNRPSTPNSITQNQKPPANQAHSDTNTTFEAADLLTPGIETQSILSDKFPNNIDFYKFNVNSPSRINIVFDHLPTSYQMTVYDPKRQVLAQTDRKGFTYSEGVVVAQDKGTYFIKVTSTYQDPNSTPYTIRIEILPFFE